MVVYHIITAFHLLSCIVHRNYYHENEDAFLIIPDFMQDKIELERFQELVDNEVFKQVIIFPYRKLGKEYKQIVENAKAAFKEATDGIDLDKATVYVYGAHFYFSIGLIENRIRYEVFEEASGAYTHQDILSDAVKNSNPVMELICHNYDILSYENRFIDKVWIDYSAQEGNFSKERTENYNIQECLPKLDDDKYKMIVSFFRLPEIEVEEKSTLLLTQHFMNLNIMSYEEQVQLYQTYVDSFLENQVVYIKPHPDDFMDYRTHLKKCKIIKGRFPVELLALTKSENLDTVATVYSTAIYTVKNFFRNSLCLDMVYRKSYKFFYQYYVAIKILEFMYQFNGFAECKGYGVDIRHIQELLRCQTSLCIKVSDFQDEFPVEPSVFLIGVEKEKDNDRELHLLKTVKDNDVIIFLNTGKGTLDFAIGHEEELERIFPVKIYINTKDYSVWDKRTLNIYVYTKNKRWREKIAKMELHKEFENLETVLDVKPMSEEEIRISVLEGVLRSTEERLMDVLEDKKE